MNRFFLTPKSIHGTTIQFPADIAHQIRHVLRLQTEDLVEVLDDSGKVYRVHLEIETGKAEVTGFVVDVYEGQTESKIPIVLYFGLTSREKVELILQKGTEVGVTSFQPFTSERTLAQTLALPAKKTERWERIIREAAEQANRSRLPQLEQPLTFSDCLKKAKVENTMNMLAWEEADTKSQDLREVLHLDELGALGLFVGPEGGFSKEEAELAQTAGCRIVSLGARILRMETAAILFPALVLFHLNAL